MLSGASCCRRARWSVDGDSGAWVRSLQLCGRDRCGTLCPRREKSVSRRRRGGWGGGESYYTATRRRSTSVPKLFGHRRPLTFYGGVVSRLRAPTAPQQPTAYSLGLLLLSQSLGINVETRSNARLPHGRACADLHRGHGKKNSASAWRGTMAPRQLRLEPIEADSTADKGAKRVRVDSTEERELNTGTKIPPARQPDARPGLHRALLPSADHTCQSSGSRHGM
eukprot:scaffold4841_cov121-Isochrysis_galbana.AAC.13